MKTKGSNTTAMVSLELKYCERCGGLWLRPVGGEQIYCVTCARQIAELPPASHEPTTAKMQRRGVGGGEFRQYSEAEDTDMDTTGGAA
ncbi:MAG: hypothetical protein WB919_19575 [Candidatus Sulfotelmatobacter sp.]